MFWLTSCLRRVFYSFTSGVMDHFFALLAFFLPLFIMSSISSISFGTFEVKLRLPSSVTRTSSSIRTPMPRYLAGAFLASAGT